ncbi:MAG: VOC family protein [Deinococcales bacterium]
MTNLTNPMQGVVPYIAMCGRTAEAIEFYARAFAAEDIGRMPFDDGSPGLMHAQVLINSGALMMTDSGMNPSTSEQRAVQADFGHLQLVVQDGRTWWNRAVAAGCAVLAPYERQPWGDDWGLLQDPFGLKWAIMQDGSVK